jgi:sulfotransferase family protein
VTTLPNLFIVGAPKSGTTSLYEWLRDHPDVYMSPFKEPCYFARDLAWETSGYYLRYGVDRDRYLALFAGANGATRVAEASTRYLYSHDAPALIAEESSDPRIVAMLRNPVDMIASLHAHKVASGTEDLPDLADAIAAENDRRAGRRIPRDSNPRLSTYTDRARFGDQLARWFDVFGRERVHVMLLDDVIRDPAAQFRRLLEFIGVDPEYRPASFETHNPAHGTRGSLVATVARSRPVQFAFWRLLPRLLGEARTLELTRRIVQSPLLRTRAAKAGVPDDLRRRLEAELRPDVERLSDLLRVDLTERWLASP